MVMRKARTSSGQALQRCGNKVQRNAGRYVVYQLRFQLDGYEALIDDPHRELDRRSTGTRGKRPSRQRTNSRFRITRNDYRRLLVGR